LSQTALSAPVAWKQPAAQDRFRTVSFETPLASRSDLGESRPFVAHHNHRSNLKVASDLASRPPVSVDGTALRNDLDALKSNSVPVQSWGKLATGAISCLAVASIGHSVWTLGGGSMLASTMSATPLWSDLDPLPVLDFAIAESQHKQRRLYNTTAQTTWGSIFA
jgi:hypothetical protein